MTNPAATTQAAATAAVGRTRRKVVAASFLGNFVEWFDYGAYSYLATTIAVVFFPSGNHAAALLSTFGVFAVSFVVRPIGALVWGRLGDRLGRKSALSVSIIIMSTATCLIAVLPTYGGVGLLAPVLLLLLRLVQGFSAAGEYAGAATFLVEYAPVRKRGSYASAVPASTATGLLFGSLLATLLTAVLSHDALVSYGWRLPFLLALPLGFAGWYIRMRLEDTPVFRTLEDPPATPLRETLRGHPKALLVGFCATLLNAVGFYMILTYIPTYLSDELGFGDVESFIATTISLVTYIGFIFVAGALSDRFGRKRALVTASVSFVVLSVPLFSLLGHANLLGVVLIEVLFGAMLTMNDGTLACFLAESFPARVRFSGFALSFNTANALFGGTAPFIATALIAATGSQLAPAWYLAGGAAVTLLAMLVSRPTTSTAMR